MSQPTAQSQGQAIGVLGTLVEARVLICEDVRFTLPLKKLALASGKQLVESEIWCESMNSVSHPRHKLDLSLQELVPVSEIHDIHDH